MTWRATTTNASSVYRYHARVTRDVALCLGRYSCAAVKMCVWDRHDRYDRYDRCDRYDRYDRYDRQVAVR